MPPRGRCAAVVLALAGGACSPTHPRASRITPVDSPSGTIPPSAPRAEAPPPVARAEATAPRTTEIPSPSLADVRAALWPAVAPPQEAAACDARDAPAECLIELAWTPGGPDARDRARALFRDLGVVPGVSPAFAMDGGYRGEIQVVPELPVGPWAHHLAWVDAALREQEWFYSSLVREHGAGVSYRWRPAALRFFRSVGRHTPAAFAADWNVSYNVAGGINDSQARVTTTLFHEVFHLNDQDHGDWSARVLAPLYDRIVARCGARTACLAPYAPNSLRVRNGTFYSFQPGNDVREYAAELCVRYYLEQSGQHRGRAFKCGPAENAEAWAALAREFFGGVDRVPACAP